MSFSTNDPALEWPPSFTFRRSMRAKRLSLRIDSERGLEVVLPKRTTEKAGLRFLNEQRAWIEKHAKHVIARNKTASNDSFELPAIIDLPAIHAAWEIDYHFIQSTKRVTCCFRDNRLIFYGAIDDFKICVPSVITWAKQQAKIHLTQMLKKFSLECELPFRKVSIRGQKTLWGSCNELGDIQLNYKILFLPDYLAQYILVHELCHTIYLDHSNAFWKLVESFVPNYRDCVKRLRQSDDLLPRWL